MSLIVRPIKSSDYEDILVGWWKSWKFEAAPSREILPDNGTGGFISFDGHVPVAAAFMYTTNSKLSWCTWIVSNREYRKKGKRKDAIKLVMMAIEALSKEQGFKFCYGIAGIPSLKDIYLSLGYTIDPADKNELIKKIG